MSLIFLFLDGVGMGLPHSKNPFYTKRYPAFEMATDGQPFLKDIKPVFKENHLFKAIDARLSVEGLPQSGTGQATIFSGQNASKLIGRHFGPFPHSRTRYLLEEKSLFHSLQRRGLNGYFMNAYPKIFFDAAIQRNRWSCTTLMVRGAGLKLNTLEDLQNEDAITAEILQDIWQSKLKADVPEITADQAAKRVLNKAQEYDFILAEYYLTDKAGHKQDPELADQALLRINDFMKSLLVDSNDEHTILMVSDHGNIEDLSTKSHTMNDVPLFVKGPGAYIFREANSLTDIKSLCLKWYETLLVHSESSMFNGA